MPFSASCLGRPRRVLWILVWMAACVLGACGESLPPPQYAAVTGLIPPETAYAVIATPTLGDAASFDARLTQRLSVYRGNLAVQNFVKVFQDVLVIDPLDPKALRGVGLDPQGDFAIISLDLWPAGIVRISDAEKLEVFLGDLRTRVKPARAELNGVEVETLAVGTARLSIARVGDYMVGVFHRAEASGVDLLAPVLRLDPAGALGRSTFFEIILGAMGPSHGVLGFVNTRMLDEALLKHAQKPSTSPLLSYLAPDRLRRYHEDHTRHLEACADAGRFISDRIPYVALGSTLEEQRWRQRLMLSLDPVAERSLQRIMPGLQMPLDALFEKALFAFAFGVDIPAFSKSADFAPSLTMCPNLAMFAGGAGVLGRSLSETDAHAVFGSSLIGALYDFDLKPGFLTKRAGVILLEAKQPLAALEGFEVFLTGVGFQQIPDVSPGGGRAYVILGAIVISVIPFEQHVALVLGEIPQTSVDQVIQAPPGQRLENPEIGRIEVRGQPLKEMLVALIDQLAMLTFINAEYARALIEGMRSMRTLTVSGRFGPESFLIDWTSDLDLAQ